MTTPASPLVTLNNGVQMPLSASVSSKAQPEKTAAAVETALRTGYRHIDTAAAYQNERQVGEVIRRSGLDRSEVFVETKVWVVDYGYDESLHAFDKSVGKLGVDQLDLLILHQPMPQRFDTTIDAYRALERLLGEGLVRAIGVSNFMPHHLHRAARPRRRSCLRSTRSSCTPTSPSRPCEHADAEHGILTQAWSPIGGITFYPGWGEDRKSVLQDDNHPRHCAPQHGKTPAQVMLRWHLQQGRSAIPKSTNPGRIAENVDVFDFELSDDELARIDALDTGKRGGPDPDKVDPSEWGINIPEA